MPSLTLFLLVLLSLSISCCECRMQSIKRNPEGKRNELLHTMETIFARDETLYQAKKDDWMQGLISGFRAFRTFCHGSSKGFNLKYKVMRSGSRHKLLGFVSNEEKSKFKESRTVEELVAMDYSGAERGPSVHNR